VDGDASRLEAAVAEFVQVIEYTTRKFDEIKAIIDEFRQTRQAEGGPKPTAILMLRDRERSNTYRTVARFPSYEEAMENSNRPDTMEMARRISDLCADQTFRNFDVIDEVIP
jgi:hypothetical protein